MKTAPPTTPALHQTDLIKAKPSEPAASDPRYRFGYKKIKPARSQEQMVNSRKEWHLQPNSDQQTRVNPHFEQTQYENPTAVQLARRASKRIHPTNTHSAQLTSLEEVSEQRNKPVKLLTYLINKLDANQSVKTPETLRWKARSQGIFTLKVEPGSLTKLNKECIAYGLISDTQSDNLLKGLLSLLCQSNFWNLSRETTSATEAQLTDYILKLDTGESNFTAQLELRFNIDNKQVKAAMRDNETSSAAAITEPPLLKKARPETESLPV